MPSSGFSGTLSGPKVEVAIDMGNPLLNVTVDGFLKIGAVAATRVAAEEAYHAVKKGSISSHNFEHTLKKMCKEGAYWGTVAGVLGQLKMGAQAEDSNSRSMLFHLIHYLPFTTLINIVKESVTCITTDYSYNYITNQYQVRNCSASFIRL